MIIRDLRRDELEQVWSIDRSEMIDNVYHHEGGQLVLKPGHYDIKGWPSGEPETSAPWLLDCFDRGGFFCGAFEDDRLVGVAVLESRFIGRGKDQLQLTFLHVESTAASRGWGARSSTGRWRRHESSVRCGCMCLRHRRRTQ